MSEYAWSSTLDVSRPAAHDMRHATLTSSSDRLWVRTRRSMPVTFSTRDASRHFGPMTSHALDKKMTEGGAMSSCRVHPRLNHLLFLNADWGALGSARSGTSSRNA